MVRVATPPVLFYDRPPDAQSGEALHLLKGENNHADDVRKHRSVEPWYSNIVAQNTVTTRKRHGIGSRQLADLVERNSEGNYCQ